MTGDLRTEAELITAEIRARWKGAVSLGEAVGEHSGAERILGKAPGYLRKLRDRAQAPFSAEPATPRSASEILTNLVTISRIRV